MGQRALAAPASSANFKHVSRSLCVRLPTPRSHISECGQVRAAAAAANLRGLT